MHDQQQTDLDVPPVHASVYMKLPSPVFYAMWIIFSHFQTKIRKYRDYLRVFRFPSFRYALNMTSLTR